MPKVLMVTPYWPPVNKVGVWRVLRTVRYLPDHQWTPVICTPRPEQVYKRPPLHDESFSVPDVQVIQPDTFIPSMASARTLARPRQWLEKLRMPSRTLKHPKQLLERVADLIDRGGFRAIARSLLLTNLSSGAGKQRVSLSIEMISMM